MQLRRSYLGYYCSWILILLCLCWSLWSQGLLRTHITYVLLSKHSSVLFYVSIVLAKTVKIDYHWRRQSSIVHDIGLLDSASLGLHNPQPPSPILQKKKEEKKKLNRRLNQAVSILSLFPYLDSRSKTKGWYVIQLQTTFSPKERSMFYACYKLNRWILFAFNLF